MSVMLLELFILTFVVFSNSNSLKPIDRSRKIGCDDAFHVKIPETTTVVEAYAFSNDKNLQVVHIPTTVLIIGPFAFHACESLTVANIPTSISSISVGTFSDCISLKEMVIPITVTSIEEQAFSGCTNLKSVIISKFLISFGNRAFFGCPQLRCISSDGYFCGFESSVSVSVGREAFAGCPLLTGHRNRLALFKVAPGIIDHLPQRSGPNGGLVCRYGAYCSRDKDCVAGNKCLFTGTYFSQCVEDKTAFLPESSGCISNYAAECHQQSTCCDPGAICRVVDDTSVMRCAPMEAPACQHPIAFMDLTPTHSSDHSESICRFGAYCITDGDCMPGNRCGVVNAYFTQCIADPSTFIKPQRGCVSDHDRDCSADDTCCDPSSICRLVGDSSVPRCAPVESPDCMTPIAFPSATAVTATQPAVLSSICQFGEFCRVDSDCVSGNKCHLVNAYYSQCVADTSSYRPAYSGCLANYASPCDSRSACCDPGAVCTAIDGGTAVCQPLKGNSCEQPEGFNTRSRTERLPAKSICRYGGYCRLDSDCVLGNKCNIVNGYYSQCVEDTSLFLPTSSGCISNYVPSCNEFSTCCDPGATCSSIDGEQSVCRPLEAPDCLQPLGYEDSVLAVLSSPTLQPTLPTFSPTPQPSAVFIPNTPTAAPVVYLGTPELKICQFGGYCTADSDCVAGNKCAMQSGGYYSQCVPDSSQYSVWSDSFRCLANNGPPCSETGNGICCDPGSKCRETSYRYFQCMQITAPACAFPTTWRSINNNGVVPSSSPTTHSGVWSQPTALPTLDAAHVNTLVRICQYGGYCLEDSDCMPGNLCAQYNPYYSQCIADPSSYIPVSSGCVLNYQERCKSDFDCCDPGAICSTSNPYYRQCMQPALPPLCLNPTGFPSISDGKLSSAKSLRKQQTVLSYLPSFDVAIDLGQHNADGVCRTILSDPAGPASPLLAAVQHVLAGNGFRHLASVKLIACKDVVAGNSFPSRRLLPDALPPTVELLTEASLAVSSTTTYSDAFQIISGLHSSLERAVSDLTFTNNVQAVSVAVKSRSFEPAVVKSVNNLGSPNSTFLFNVSLLICQYGFYCRTNMDCVLGNKCVFPTSVDRNSSSSQCVPDNYQIRTDSCVPSSTTSSSPSDSSVCQSDSDCCDPGAICDSSRRCSQPAAPLCIMPTSAYVDEVLSSQDPSEQPVRQPTQSPSNGSPTSSSPTSAQPSILSTEAPTSIMSSFSPSALPTEISTSIPSESPSDIPSTLSTSHTPSMLTSSIPSESPSDIPSTSSPFRTPPMLTSSIPSELPSNIPSSSPSHTPPLQISSITNIPSESPFDIPSCSPSYVPSNTPSESPSNIPLRLPSATPTESPSKTPSFIPSNMPSIPSSESPSNVPSESPSKTPTSNTPTEAVSTVDPTVTPTSKPTNGPSYSFSSLPTAKPSVSPTLISSELPTSNPSIVPSSRKPTSLPTSKPTSNPTLSPSVAMTEEPSAAPTGDPTAAATDTPSSAVVTKSPSAVPSKLQLVLPAVTFQSLLALANASSALLGLGDSPTDAHYRAALVATMDSILKLPPGSTTYKQDSNRVRSQNRLLVSSSQAITVVSRVQTTASLLTFPSIQDPSGLQQFHAMKSSLTIAVDSGEFLQEMRHQLSVYSDTLPPNAAYVNVTSVNMLLLASPTQSPSAAGTATPSSATVQNSLVSGSRGNGDNITAVAVSVSLSALVLVISMIAAAMAIKRYLRHQEKNREPYHAPSVMPSDSVAADISLGTDDRQIIVGNLRGESKVGSEDNEDVKTSRYIRPWAAMSGDGSALSGKPTSFRFGDKKKASWWNIFLPNSEKEDEVQVSGLPAQDEGLSRMSSVESISKEVDLKSVQTSDFKVYVRSATEGADALAAGTNSHGERSLLAAAEDASSVNVLANMNVSVKSCDSVDVDADQIISGTEDFKVDSRDW